MLIVEIDRVDCVEEVHHARYIPQGRFHDQVIMVWHQAIDMDFDSEFLMSFPETLEKEELILVGKEDRLFLVPPGKDMIKGAGILDP